MANDAKMGLLAGLSAVLVIAVVCYQKSPLSANPASAPGFKAKSSPRPAALDPILFPEKPAPSEDVLLRASGE